MFLHKHVHQLQMLKFILASQKKEKNVDQKRAKSLHRRTIFKKVIIILFFAKLNVIYQSFLNTFSTKVKVMSINIKFKTFQIQPTIAVYSNYRFKV